MQSREHFDQPLLEFAAEFGPATNSIRDDVVWLDGLGCATASMSVLRRPDLVGLPVEEASRALRGAELEVKSARAKPRELQVVLRTPQASRISG